jgi:hypothetical protein
MRIASATVADAVYHEGAVHYRLRYVVAPKGAAERSDDEEQRMIKAVGTRLAATHGATTGDNGGGDPPRSQETWRRYSEFVRLRKDLLLAGCQDSVKELPSLPPKSPRSARDKVISARKVGLERWLGAALQVHGDHGLVIQFFCSERPTEPTSSSAPAAATPCSSSVVGRARSQSSPQTGRGSRLPGRRRAATETPALQPRPNLDIRFDVMVSYAASDRRIARALSDRLRAEELSVWLPSISSMAKQTKSAAQKSVEGAHVVLCCACDDYAATRSHEYEHLARLCAGGTTSGPAVVPLLMQADFCERATGPISTLMGGGSSSQQSFDISPGSCFDTVATELIEHVQSLLPAARRKNLSPPASPALTPRSLRRNISFKDTCHPQAEECREVVCEAVPPASSRRAIAIPGESSVPVRRTLSEQPRSIGRDGTVAAVAVVKLQLDPALTEAAPDDFTLR